jgi:hypothetical protein
MIQAANTQKKAAGEVNQVSKTFGDDQKHDSLSQLVCNPNFVLEMILPSD